MLTGQKKKMRMVKQQKSRGWFWLILVGLVSLVIVGIVCAMIFSKRKEDDEVARSPGAFVEFTSAANEPNVLIGMNQINFETSVEITPDDSLSEIKPSDAAEVTNEEHDLDSKPKIYIELIGEVEKENTSEHDGNIIPNSQPR